MRKINAELCKGAAPFLRFVMAHHVPDDKKFTVTNEMVIEAKVKKTLLKISRIFHPDKNVNEPADI